MQNKIASRYAKALFSLMINSSASDIPLCAEALNALATIYEENMNVREILSCPTISSKEKEGLIVEFLSTMDVALPVLESFTVILVNSGRISLIASIAETYQMLVDEKNHIKRGFVSTSQGVDDASKGLIQNFVEKQFNDPVILSYTVEPELLGGFVLKVDDLVYDASLKTQLANLKENIKKGVY